MIDNLESSLELRLALALILGFLVGLERESTKIDQQKLVFGGVRTHPIISLLGFGCAWLFKVGATLMLPAGFASIIVLTAVAYYAKIKGERFGSTSEISALLTFVVGALSLLVDAWIPMSLGIVNAMLLSEKARLEKFVQDLDRVDFLATLKFLLVTLIILPVLPDQEFTQFRLNPSKIWKVVILVSSIGFLGYVLSKKFGEKIGLWLSGLLGGIVSSTAFTIAVGRLAAKQQALARNALQAAILASSIMYIRILVLVALINAAFVPSILWRLLTLFSVGILLSLRFRPEMSSMQEVRQILGLENPFEVTPALMFGVLFVVLSVVTSFVQTLGGETGILTLAGVVGVTDETPFILSIVRNPDTLPRTATLAMFIAMMSNTIMKGLYFVFLVPSVRRETLLRFGIFALLHVPVILSTLF